jgi:hypothetical protein
MKKRFILTIVVCAIGFIAGMLFVRFLGKKSATTIMTVKRDTVLIAGPIAVSHSIDTINKVKIVYREKKDTLKTCDTIEKIIYLPREKLVYKDSTYRAVVSGVQPSLDSITVYKSTVYKTITNTVIKRNKFGLGVQAGYGVTGSKLEPYIGIGISYNFITW